MNGNAADLDKDVQISLDGSFNSGHDTQALIFKYEARNIEFWFNLESAFLSDDQRDFVIKIDSIGQRHRREAGLIPLDDQRRQIIYRNITEYFSKNTLANIMSSHARLVRIEFLVDPPFAVNV
jgi:hypothetical protein